MGRAKGAAVVLATAPAYTFGSGSHTQRYVDDNGPGPGAYNVRVTGSQYTNLARGGGFGTSGRLAPYGNGNPAPGEYNVNNKLTHKRCRETLVRGRQAAADSLKQHQPGPGQYPEVPSSVTHPEAPAVSISHRLPDSREAERRPAPGDYTPDLYRCKSPIPVTIKHKRGAAAADRPDSGHAVPGPGEYRPQDVQINSRHAPAYTLGGSRPTASRSVNTPGPADYSPYLQQSPAAVTAAGSFGKSEREPTSHYEVRPGPGSYLTHRVTQRPAGHSVDSLRRSSPAVTIGVRDLSGWYNSIPGPSDYGVPRDGLVRASSPCYTFKGVPAKDHLIKHPGPGHYNPDRHTDVSSSHQVAPSVSISHRYEPPHSQQRRPAPGDYTPDLYHSKSPLPVTIKHKRGAAAADRPDSGHAVPGPGEYKLSSTLGGPKITFGLKLDNSGSNKYQQQMPGCADYDVHESTLGVAGLA